MKSNVPDRFKIPGVLREYCLHFCSIYIWTV